MVLSPAPVSVRPFLAVNVGSLGLSQVGRLTRAKPGAGPSRQSPSPATASELVWVGSLAWEWLRAVRMLALGRAAPPGKLLDVGPEARKPKCRAFRQDPALDSWSRSLECRLGWTLEPGMALKVRA